MLLPNLDWLSFHRVAGGALECRLVALRALRVNNTALSEKA